jgi:hypothetical protein
MARVLLVLGILLLSGCTSRSWYEAFQAQQRLQCERYVERYEARRCLERVNQLSYDQYRNQTGELQSRP